VNWVRLPHGPLPVSHRKLAYAGAKACGACHPGSIGAGRLERATRLRVSDADTTRWAGSFPNEGKTTRKPNDIYGFCDRAEN